MVMAETTTIEAEGRITIPPGIREAAHLRENDAFEVELTPDGILLRPHRTIDPAQAWFWTPEWQTGEREADEDKAAGRFTRYESGEDFLESLKRRRGHRADP